MYQVSESFKLAANQPVQEHRITGTIGSVSFTENNIVSGSFSISNQSTDTSDVVLGSCYVGQLTAEFTGINISYGSWINKTITPTFELKTGTNTWESVPLGIFKIKEAKHTEHGVQVTAYDNMIKFDKKFKKNHFKSISGMYNIISQLCTDSGVTLGMTQGQIEALPNGSRTDIKIYGLSDNTDEFANDITINRDLLFWIAQTMGCFATINRSGQLVFRKYTQTVTDVVSEHNRIEGATFADYVTHYIGIYVSNLNDSTEDYYGYNSTELQQELNETNAEITTDQQRIAELDADLVEWKRKLDNHECTQQEYDEAVAAIDAELTPLKKEVKQLRKRVIWLEQALAQAGDDGADMVLGANPLLMESNITKRDNERKAILNALSDISYTPFTASVVCGCIYDLGDVIQFSGGLYNSETDSFGCVMSYTYTHNGGTELEGFGVDPSIVVIRNKTLKSTDKADRNTYKAAEVGQNATHNTTGFESYIDPESQTPSTIGKDGDMHVVLTPPVKIQRHINSFPYWYATQLVQNKDGKYNITVTGYSDSNVTPINTNGAIFKAIGFGGAGTYHISCKMQFDGYINAPWANIMGLYLSYDDSGIYFSHESQQGTLVTTPIQTFLLNMYFDNLEHEYSFDFTIDEQHANYIVNKTMYIAVVVARCWKYENTEPVGHAEGTLTIKDLEITGSNVQPETEMLGIEVKVGDKWQNIDYVNKVSQTQGSTGGTEIAEIENTNGTKTKVYQKTVTPNPQGTATGELKSITIGSEVFSVGGNVDDVKVDDVSIVSNKVANINTMTGATVQEDGAKGLVPTPTAADSEKYLKGDGTWAEVQGGGGSAEMLAPTPFIYSETEEQVGIWIDGKPLYQKTVNFGAFPNNATKTVSHNISNIDYVVTAIGYGDNGTQFFPIPFVNNDVIGSQVMLYITRSEIVARTSVDRSPFSKCYVTIQYTKTTDTAWQGGFKAYGFSPVIYSDTEREIGVWRDGKPLYQKTISGTTITGGQTTNVAHNIANIDKIINSEIIAHFSDNNYWRTLNFAYNNGYVQDSWFGGYAIDATNIHFQIGTAFSATLDKWYATVFYTKTTDTAGSGKYTTLGTPSVHYDGEERVIGTWFGETLYQRTFSGLSVSLGADWVNAIDISSLNVSKCIEGIGVASSGYQTPLCTNKNGNYIQVYMNGMAGVTLSDITVKYTKTT